MKPTPETIEKRRITWLRNMQDPEIRARRIANRKESGRIGNLSVSAEARRRGGAAGSLTKRSPEYREKMKDHYAMIKAISTGRKHSTKAKAAISRAGIGRKPSQKAIEATRAMLLGGHGRGRAMRDRPDHGSAKHWIVRAPNNLLYEFDNLQAWCRANEHLLLPDMTPWAKLPLWRRAAGGFSHQLNKRGKATHHWRGWILVSCVERYEQGAPDLLGREVAGEVTASPSEPAHESESASP
jgi:hypothetical protein